MLWELEHGKHIALYQKLASEGRTTPLELKPKANPITLWYLDVFTLLSNQRTRGYEPNPIQLSEMLAFCDSFELVDDKATFVQVVAAIDTAYMKYVSDKQKKQTSQKGKR